MNFKIQQTYPSPTHGLNAFNTLTFAQGINSLILYGEQKNQSDSTSQQQPKKKIAFKVDKSATAVSCDKISIFSIADRKWSIIEAKGKIPTTRTQFKCIYMKPCMIMYGGKSNGKLLNQVYALNCQTWTWKKLFSLDGPPLSQYSNNMFFKISDTTAGLIVTTEDSSVNCLWLLHLTDVKWQLTANQLPGSVWQKINLPLPQKIKFCFPISEEIILIVGQKITMKINIKLRQKLSEFEYDQKKQLQLFGKEKQQLSKISNTFNDFYLSQLNCSNSPQGKKKLNYIYVVFSKVIQILSYKNIKSKNMEQLVPLLKKQQRQKSCIKLERQIKCCAYQCHHNNKLKSIYYIDTKGELISVEIKLNKQLIEKELKQEQQQQIQQQEQQQQNTTRKISQRQLKNEQNQNNNESDNEENNQDRNDEDQNNQNLLQNNSCILQQQQNQQSSLLVPSSNSRIKVQSNSRIDLDNKFTQSDFNYANQQQLEDNQNELTHNQKSNHNYNNYNRQNSIPNSKMTATNQNQSNVMSHNSSLNKMKNKDAQQQPTKHHHQHNKQHNREKKQQISVTTSKNTSINSNVNTNINSNANTLKRNIYNINNSQTNPTQKLSNQQKQRFKHKTQQHNEQKHLHRHHQHHQHHHHQQYHHKRANAHQQQDSTKTSQQLKQKLQTILYNQSIKRKLLQAKCHSLQTIIKKSQKFVLMLCKYGNNTEKQKHIEKVREIRQQLQLNWNKQVYYKKQMEGNKMPAQISQNIQKTMSYIQY